MADIRVYSYNQDWTKQIDSLLMKGIDPKDITTVFNNLVEERVQEYQRNLRRELHRSVLANAIEDYVVGLYGDMAKRNYSIDDYTSLATGMLDHIDKNMEELRELEGLGYCKVDEFEAVQEDSAEEEDSLRMETPSRRRTSRVAQNSPEKVLADFVKNL